MNGVGQGIVNSQPSDFGGLVLWLDGGDAATFGMDNDDVVSWMDKSGNGNDAVPPSTFRPNRSQDLSGLTFPNQSSFTIANTVDINLGAPSTVKHSVCFTPGNSLDTKIVYEEGGGGNGLSIFTHNGRIWNNMWSGAPLGLSPNFVDLVDQAPAVPGQMVCITMSWNQATQERKLYQDGLLTHTQAVGSVWPSHQGDIRLGVAGDILYPVGIDEIAPGADSFDGVLHEVIRWQDYTTEPMIFGP